MERNRNILSSEETLDIDKYLKVSQVFLKLSHIYRHVESTVGHRISDKYVQRE